MLVLGLTGSIGMGKSEAAKSFSRAGVPVFDADSSVHRMYLEDTDLIKQVGEAFLGVVKDGSVDRAALGEKVFGNDLEIKRLEEIIHPHVTKERERFLRLQKGAGEDLAVLDIPLLYEKGVDVFCDKVLVVSCPENIQMDRVMQRNGMTSSKLSAILAKQMPDAEKRKRADFIIETDKGIEVMDQEIKALINDLRNTD